MAQCQLGHLAIQLMRALSQTDLIVVDKSQAALDHAKEWGADHAILAREDRSHVQRLLVPNKGSQRGQAV